MRRMIILTMVASLGLACGLKPSGERKPAENDSPEKPEALPLGSVEKPPRHTKFSTKVQLQFSGGDQDGLTTFGDVEAIFKRECTTCHNSAEDFDLRNFPFSSIGEPDSARLVDLIIERVSSDNPEFRMPYDVDTWGPGKALPQNEINLLKKWAKDGLLAQAPESHLLDEAVDTVVLEYTTPDKATKKVILSKVAKRSGLYETVVEKVPAKLNSLRYVLYSEGRVTGELAFEDYNAMANPKLFFTMNIEKKYKE